MGFSLILTAEEIQLLREWGICYLARCPKGGSAGYIASSRLAPVFGICLYGATRIREACTFHNAPDSLNPLDFELDFKNEQDSSKQHTDWGEERE